MVARSDQALLEELATLEHRLRRTNDETQLRRILVMFNNIRDESRTRSQFVRARFFFLKGMVYAKVSRNYQSSFLGSSGDALQVALGLFNDADMAILAEAEQHGWTGELYSLRQRTAYEAISLVTVLKVWGRDLSALPWPDTNVLDTATQRKVQSALRHNYILNSRF